MLQQPDRRAPKRSSPVACQHAGVGDATLENSLARYCAAMSDKSPCCRGVYELEQRICHDEGGHDGSASAGGAATGAGVGPPICRLRVMVRAASSFGKIWWGAWRKQSWANGEPPLSIYQCERLILELVYEDAKCPRVCHPCDRVIIWLRAGADRQPTYGMLQLQISGAAVPLEGPNSHRDIR